MSGVGVVMGAAGVTGVMGYSGRSSAQVRKETKDAKDVKDTTKPSDPPIATIINPKTGRAIKLRIRLPAQVSPTGLILYSPGLGSGTSNGHAWCEAWRQAGYVVVNLAHPVTDDSIWRTSDKHSFNTNMQLALAGPQYGLRVSDCSFVLDHCLKSAELAPYIDPARVGLAGHSYGALTAQTIAGQPLGATNMRDPRIKAVIAFSPGATSPERARSMSRVQIPFFCVTGDYDQFVTFKKDGEAIKLGVSLANRELVYANLPAGEKLQLKLRDADHMSFAGEPVDALRFSRDIKATESGHQALWGQVSQMTTAFWEYYLAVPGHSIPPTKEAFEARLRAMLSPGEELKFG